MFGAAERGTLTVYEAPNGPGCGGWLRYAGYRSAARSILARQGHRPRAGRRGGRGAVLEGPSAIPTGGRATNIPFLRNIRRMRTRHRTRPHALVAKNMAALVPTGRINGAASWSRARRGEVLASPDPGSRVGTRSRCSPRRQGRRTARRTSRRRLLCRRTPRLSRGRPRSRAHRRHDVASATGCARASSSPSSRR